MSRTIPIKVAYSPYPSPLLQLGSDTLRNLSPQQGRPPSGQPHGASYPSGSPSPSQRPAEFSRTASPQRGNDIARSPSPRRGSELSQGAFPQRGSVSEAPCRSSVSPGSSSRRGSELSQGLTSPQSGSEAPRRTSPPRGANLPPPGSSSRRGSELSQGPASPQSGSEAPRRTSPPRGANLPPPGSSSRRGSELSQGPASPQSGSEAPRRTSPPRGANLPPPGSSSRRGSELSHAPSLRQPDDLSWNASPPRGSDASRSTSPRRGSDLSQSSPLSPGHQPCQNVPPQGQSDLHYGSSPQRRWPADRSSSPQTLVDYRCGRYSIHPGQFSMASSHMLMAMQQCLNSQREEMCRRPRPAAEREPDLGKPQTERKNVPASPMPSDSPQPAARYYARPVVSPRDDLTQMPAMRRDSLQVPKMSPQPPSESGQRDPGQPPKKLVLKHVPNPKNEWTQTEPAYQVSFLPKSGSPQMEVWTATGVEARAKTSPPPDTIRPSPQLETRASYKLPSPLESKVDYRFPLHQEMEAACKFSLSTETGQRRSSLQAHPAPPRRSPPPQEPDARRSSLQTRPEMTQASFRPASHPESESEYRCLLHQEMEAAARKEAEQRTSSLHTGPGASRRSSIAGEPEARRTSCSHPETSRRASLLKDPSPWSEAVLSPRGSLQPSAPALYTPAFHPESESEYRCLLHRELEAAQRRPLLPSPEVSHRGTLGVLPMSRQGSVSTDQASTVDIWTQTEPCRDSRPVPRGSLQPSTKATLEVATYPQVTVTLGTSPPRGLGKFGPQSSWWPLLQADTISPLPDWAEQRAGSPLPNSVEKRGPFPAPDLEDNMLAFLVEAEVALDVPQDNLSISSKELLFVPAHPEPLASSSLVPEQRDQRPECAGPSDEAEDLISPRRGKSVSKFSAFFVDVSDKMHADILWWLKDEEIKHLLKEDSNKVELAQFLSDYPAEETFCRVESDKVRKEEGAGREEPGMFASAALRTTAHDAAEEKDLKASRRPRPLDLKQPQQPQQHMAAPAPSSPSRPRSPWGRLDPYDSDEDDKEYVGFATLPNQVHRKSVKKGFDFTLMVAGESGLGKSTLVNSLFLTDLYKEPRFLNAEERILQTVEITKHVVDIEEKGVRLRLTIVDTPGFGDAVNNTECWKPVADYIDQQFEQYFRDESGLNRKNIQDNRVHCCLYFISPFGHGLRPLDIEFMKAVHQRVNIVPVLAKADSLMPSEVVRMKNKVRDEIDQFGIRIYQFPDCDSDEDEDFKQQDQALKESIPFAVIGSNTVVEAKGRRIRGRLYPWGVVEVENPVHSDFIKLRTMLVRTHMQDLKDVTRETHYENYRAQCIQSMTRMVVKERNRNKLTRESGTDFPLPAIPPMPDAETEKLIREKDEELRRMQEMLEKIQRQMEDTH